MGKFYFRLVCAVVTALISLVGSVTASAQTYDVLYGTKTTADGVTTIANQTDFAGDANEVKDIKFTDGNGNTKSFAIDGSALFANKKNSWTKNFTTPITQGKVYFNGDYTVSANNNKTFNIVDKDGNVIFASTSASGSKNSTYIVATICGKEISNYVRLPRSAGYRVNLIIDLDLKVVTYTLVISSGNGKTNTLTGSEALTTDNVKGLLVYKTSYGCYLDNVALYSVQSAEQKYPATINYQLNGTTVYTNSLNLTAGSVATSNKIVTDEAGQKYFIIADEAPTLTVTADGDNTLNVPVRKAYSATLNVTYNVGGTETTAKSDLIEADDKTTNWSYAYPLYKKGEDGKYYKADNSEAFGESGTFKDGEEINKTVNYTKAEDDVVYFTDASSVAGTNLKYSNGESGVVKPDNARDRGINVGTLEAGTYNFIVNITATNGRSVVIRHSTEDPLASITTTRTSGDGLQSDYFTLAEATELVVNGANSGTSKINQSEDFDYVLIKKLPTSLTINSTSNLVSYSNDYAVTVPDDVVIYKATEVNDNTVSLAKVNTTVIPAKTGVILYSAETGEKTLTYGGEADASLYEGNVLKGTGNSTVTVAADDNIYALLAGTQSFAKVNEGVELPANKAYLAISANAGAKLNVVIDGQTTGINSVESAEDNAENLPAYNLAGQRVGKNYKGIVVKNGRKYIVK